MTRELRNVTTKIHWNSEGVRAAIQRFITREKITSISKWEGDAGLSQGLLRKFLRGKTKDIGLAALARLAHVRNVTIGHLIGETDGPPPAVAEIDVDLLGHVIAQLDQMAEELGVKPDSVDPALRARAIAAVYDMALHDVQAEVIYRNVARLIRPGKPGQPRLVHSRAEARGDPRATD
jgi:transcriptional regulator with XRE-family HTH domain